MFLFLYYSSCSSCFCPLIFTIVVSLSSFHYHRSNVKNIWNLASVSFFDVTIISRFLVVPCIPTPSFLISSSNVCHFLSILFSVFRFYFLFKLRYSHALSLSLSLLLSHFTRLIHPPHTARTHTYLRVTIDMRFVTFLASRQCVPALSSFVFFLFYNIHRIFFFRFF